MTVMQEARIKTTTKGTNANPSTAYDSFGDGESISQTGKNYSFAGRSFTESLGEKRDGVPSM
jgi:hypothetical protein